MVDDLLRDLVERQGSDLHLVDGQVPKARIHGVLEQVSQGLLDGAVFPDRRMTHARIAEDGGGSKAIELKGAGGYHARPNGSGGFTRLGLPEFIDAEGGRLDVNVDAIEERTADPAPVSLDLSRGILAAAVVVQTESTRGGVHGGDQHEGTGQGDLSGTS